MINRATFGPGGNSDSFVREGHKSTVEAPGWVARRGLDAYEYEAGRGVNAGEDVLRKIGAKAREHGILMSLHTPYFISLSGADPEKRLKSVDYIQKSLWAAELLGADTIVIHCGGAAKMDRREAMELSRTPFATSWRRWETPRSTWVLRPWERSISWAPLRRFSSCAPLTRTTIPWWTLGI